MYFSPRVRILRCFTKPQPWLPTLNISEHFGVVPGRSCIWREEEAPLGCDVLESTIWSCCLVYGNCPPHSRKEESDTRWLGIIETALFSKLHKLITELNSKGQVNSGTVKAKGCIDLSPATSRASNPATGSSHPEVACTNPAQKEDSGLVVHPSNCSVQSNKSSPQEAVCIPTLEPSESTDVNLKLCDNEA